MSFFDTLKGAGLWPQQGQGQPQDNPYGLDPAMMRQARMASLGNIGSQLLAASVKQTAGSRANVMSNADWTGGYQNNLYNAARMQQLSQQQQQQKQDRERQQQAQMQIAEMIRRTPPGRQRDAAMFYLQSGDIDKAGQVLFKDPAETKPPEMKTIRVGDKDVTYAWDATANRWVKFGEGVAFKPDAPPEGAKPSDRLALYKDYENAPETQAYNTLATTLGSLSQAVNDDSKVSDLDFIYGVAKALDPASVVRESEGQMVVDSQGLTPSLLGRLNGILGGGQLTPDKRRELYALVRRRAGEYRKQAETRRGQTLAIGNGIIGEGDLRPLPPLIDLPAPPSPAPQATAPGRTNLPRPQLMRVDP